MLPRLFVAGAGMRHVAATRWVVPMPSTAVRSRCTCRRRIAAGMEAASGGGLIGGRIAGSGASHRPADSGSIDGIEARSAPV